MQSIFVDKIALIIFMLANLPGPCVCGSTAQKFSRRQGQKVNQGYTQIDGTSAAGCTAACGSDDTCKAISYRAQDGVCLLSEHNPDDESANDKYSNDGDWTMYKKRQCLTGWVLQNGTCHKWTGVSRSWPDAEAWCQNVGAHLTTIQSDEENEFIDWPGYTRWTGLNDLDDDGIFAWASGETLLAFTKWADGEPAEAENKTCVWLSHSQWYAVDCYSTSQFFCEMDQS